MVICRFLTSLDLFSLHMNPSRVSVHINLAARLNKGAEIMETFLEIISGDCCLTDASQCLLKHQAKGGIQDL